LSPFRQELFWVFLGFESESGFEMTRNIMSIASVIKGRYNLVAYIDTVTAPGMERTPGWGIYRTRYVATKYYPFFSVRGIRDGDS